MKYNYILDDHARKELIPFIQQMNEKVPDTIARKIPKGLVQQAFMLQAIQEQVPPQNSILCIGAFEDTAFEVLMMSRSPYVIGIDTVWDTDLGRYYQEIIGKKQFDCIFATSVIEHVSDDELFIHQIEDLLAPNGVMFLTMDFKHTYSPKLFSGIYRFYTEHDLKVRLNSVLSHSVFIDEPDWKNGNLDFEMIGHHYAFATFSRRKL